MFLFESLSQNVENFTICKQTGRTKEFQSFNPENVLAARLTRSKRTHAWTTFENIDINIFPVKPINPARTSPGNWKACCFRSARFPKTHYSLFFVDPLPPTAPRYCWRVWKTALMTLENVLLKWLGPEYDAFNSEICIKIASPSIREWKLPNVPAIVNQSRTPGKWRIPFTPSFNFVINFNSSFKGYPGSRKVSRVFFLLKTLFVLFVCLS